MAAFVDEVAGQLQIFRFAGRVGHLAEGKFNLLVPGISVFFALFRAENGCDIVGVTTERIDEFTVSGGAEMGDRSFHQVSGAVEFVPIEDVRPPLVRFCHREMGV
ncbi:hypothetical protein SDC9_185041 [bioreactor metagenome]|uniref:Uncharacterized protein n=1 Tax=bioreactor metagenome TaxID=1076179 RepID=A0A645HER8_9ZZZZ